MGIPCRSRRSAATLGVWIILSSLIDPIDRLRRRLRLPCEPRRHDVAHIGLGVFVLGITFVQSNSIERDVALKPRPVSADR